MFFTMVPRFSVAPAPFTFRSLVIVTLSPAFSSVPFASFGIFSPLNLATILLKNEQKAKPKPLNLKKQAL